MTQSKLLSAAFIAAVTLATPAMARTGHVTSWHPATAANPSAPITHHFAGSAGFAGPAGARASRIDSFAMDAADGATCDVGDDPHIC